MNTWLSSVLIFLVLQVGCRKATFESVDKAKANSSNINTGTGDGSGDGGGGDPAGGGPTCGPED